MQKKNPTEQKEHESDFVCQQCGKYHFQSLEAAFQRATGHDFTWRCDCGNEILLVGVAKENALTPEQFFQFQKRVLATQREAQEKLTDDLLVTVMHQCEVTLADLQSLFSMKNDLRDHHLVRNSDTLWQLWEKYRNEPNPRIP